MKYNVYVIELLSFRKREGALLLTFENRTQYGGVVPDVCVCVRELSTECCVAFFILRIHNERKHEESPKLFFLFAAIVR